VKKIVEMNLIIINRELKEQKTVLQKTLKWAMKFDQRSQVPSLLYQTAVELLEAESKERLFAVFARFDLVLPSQKTCPSARHLASVWNQAVECTRERLCGNELQNLSYPVMELFSENQNHPDFDWSDAGTLSSLSQCLDCSLINAVVWERLVADYEGKWLAVVDWVSFEERLFQLAETIHAKFVALGGVVDEDDVYCFRSQLKSKVEISRANLSDGEFGYLPFHIFFVEFVAHIFSCLQALLPQPTFCLPARPSGAASAVEETILLAPNPHYVEKKKLKKKTLKKSPVVELKRERPVELMTEVPRREKEKKVKIRNPSDALRREMREEQSSAERFLKKMKQQLEEEDELIDFDLFT
jgi:hypothetical protein